MRAALIIPVLSLAIWVAAMVWIAQGKDVGVAGVRRVKPRRIRRKPKTLSKRVWASSDGGDYDLEVDDANADDAGA